MEVTAQEFVDFCKEYVGVKEGSVVHLKILEVYNKHKPLARGYTVKPSDSWCATFISTMAILNEITDIIPTECGCEKMIELFKKIGSWVENENRVPNVGDIVFYDWNDSGAGDCKGFADHVGIVEKVSRETFTVIEGNYNDSVKRRTIGINAKNIRGFGVPKYAKEVSKPSETVSEVPNCITEIARLVIAGRFGNGEERKENIYNEIQKEVNRLLKG